MHSRRFCMRWIIREWPAPSADGLGPRLVPNRSVRSDDWKATDCNALLPSCAQLRFRPAPRKHHQASQQSDGGPSLVDAVARTRSPPQDVVTSYGRRQAHTMYTSCNRTVPGQPRIRGWPGCVQGQPRIIHLMKNSLPCIEKTTS